jgi:hypothetical protein
MMIRLPAIVATSLLLVPGAAMATAADTRANQATNAVERIDPDTTEFELASGADYSVGKYGQLVDTKVWSIPVDLKFRSNGLRLEASLPYVVMTGPGQMVGGVIVTDPGSTATVKRSGLGDLNLTAGYLLNHEAGALPAFELSGSAKLPTAKTTIGTGKADFSATISAYKSLGPTTMLFGSVGYSWLGSPAAYQLRNGITASGGLNLRPSEATNLGASLSYREPVAAGLKGQAVVSPYMTYRINKRFGLTLYGMAGLNDASPRLGAGLRLSLFN